MESAFGVEHGDVSKAFKLRGKPKTMPKSAGDGDPFGGKQGKMPKASAGPGRSVPRSGLGGAHNYGSGGQSAAYSTSRASKLVPQKKYDLG